MIGKQPGQLPGDEQIPRRKMISFIFARAACATGQAVTISAASANNRDEDGVPEARGTVTDFFAAGRMSSAMNLHFGSGEPGGVTAATVWIADAADLNGWTPAG
jgi:hypothetical protein